MLEHEKLGAPFYCYPPCGGVATFDDGSGFGYRCEDCGAVIGSVGMPQHCKDAEQKYENWKILGGKGWDWEKGQEIT